MRNLERGLSKKIDQMKKNQERRPSTDEMAVVEEETAEDNVSDAMTENEVDLRDKKNE